MKYLKLSIFFLLIACVAMAQKGTNYGQPVKPKKAVAVTVLEKKLDTASSWTGTVTGVVKQVCKREGCWLRLEDGSAEGLMVRMKDHEFTVPKDIDGKTVFVAGTVTKTTTSVKMLKHYAEDAGKSQAEIDAITAPGTALTIEATGVKIQ